MWLKLKLHVLNKGNKKCELGDSLQNTGRKCSRNSWRTLGRNFVFEHGSGQPNVCLLLCTGISVMCHACNVSPVPEAYHCSCILPSLWKWTVWLNELYAVGILFMLLNLSKCSLLSLGSVMLCFLDNASPIKLCEVTTTGDCFLV